MVSAPDSDSLPPRWQRAWRWGVPGFTLVALALLALNCVFNPKIHFLTPGPGQWIVYPLPPEGHTYPAFELVGVFRRDFVLSEKPASATLSWRCFTNGGVSVNGTVVLRPGPASESWKTTSQADIARFLRQGTNEILVLVTNRLGPPALSLELKSDVPIRLPDNSVLSLSPRAAGRESERGVLTTDRIDIKTGSFRLTSDESWEVSVSGSDWRSALASSATPRAGKGDELSLLETTGGAWGRCWRWECVFAAISICGVALLQCCAGRVSLPKKVLILLAAAWALLLIHNFPFVPLASGFDGPAHLEYVSYIQDHHWLPNAREGWEMVQPPLYYMIAAKLLDLGGCKAIQPLGALLLRYLNLVIGAATLALIFTGLRLIFPGDWKKPLAGVVFAAFLPAQLCLLHYTTNETLSAMFVTAALCVTLHLLREHQPWWGWHGVLGIVLGLALWSKASAVPVVPAILGALAVKLMLRRERALHVWLGTIGAPLLICLCMSGWHYLQLWRDFGNPLTGGWDPKVVAPWWQIKGFQTPAYYFSFGDALTRPFFSGLHSFWDAFYTTLWGDGLLGGKIDVWGRPPWNYDLMAVGYVLALAPTVLVLTGLVRTLAMSFRAANLAWILLIGLGWLFAFAILDMSLKVPSYSHTKAFFGLPVLLTFCALLALGFEYWAGRGKAARYALGVALGIWLVNLYASLWIIPDSAQTELSSGIATSVYGKQDATEAFLNVLHHYPGNSQATIWLASLESPKHLEQAVNLLEQALKHNPANAAIESFLARDLLLCNRLDEAVIHAKHAVELAPEDEVAARMWCAVALRHKDYEETVAAGRHALSLNPADGESHFNLGVALMNLRQIPEAISQLSAIVNAQPAWADAQFCLGLCLLDQPGKRDEGLGHLREAARLNPANTAWQTMLQGALEGH
ncbi:MAG: glycosyltransferase family 39 protein [Verrucomicrobiota bacterium]